MRAKGDGGRSAVARARARCDAFIDYSGRMALAPPLSIALGRFKRLPQRSTEVWQGGIVRFPMWNDNPADPEGPRRATGAIWVSLRTGRPGH